MIAVRYDIVRDPITQWQPKVKVDESKREILDSDLPRGVAWWRYHHQFAFNHLNHGFHVSVVPHA